MQAFLRERSLSRDAAQKCGWMSRASLLSRAYVRRAECQKALAYAAWTTQRPQ